MFEALQTLIDSDLLNDESVRSALDKIASGDDFDESDRKRAALLCYLLDSGDKVSPEDVDATTYDANCFDTPGAEYLVLTDDEADQRAADYIKDSLWAFRPEFLAGETGIDSSVFEALADKCEGANEPIMSIVRGSCGIDEIVESAVSADGRGHYLSHYDGEENEYGDYYIYRTN